jgi:hypothetical protein
MTYRRFWIGVLTAAVFCALAARGLATGVPIGGFLPMVGIGLTDEFMDDFTFTPIATSSPLGGTLLGPGGTPHYDVALLDTGAAVSILTSQGYQDFGLSGPAAGVWDSYDGTNTIGIGGATGTLEAEINDPFGLYAGGLQNRTGAAPFTMNNSGLRGQTNTSTITIPAESDLPNVVGLSYASQYATYIHADQPQIFSLNGKTVRSPAIDFLALGSGGQGITRRAPMSLNPSESFAQGAIAYFPDFNNPDLLDHPQDNPFIPTIIQGGLFLNVNVANKGSQLNNSQFFFDTGAVVSVVSELTALHLGFDAHLDTPDFTVSVLGSGGTKQDVPGFYLDQFTIQAVGGSVTATHVPVVVLDVADPSNPANVVPGIVGTSLLAGRNLVIDPVPSNAGGASPSLYISDPVTAQNNWATAAASGSWASASSWSPTVPGVLGVANVRNAAANGNQEAIIGASTTAWEVNVSGSTGKAMKVRVQNGTTLTTFSGINIESAGTIQLEGGSLDAQFVEIQGGTLTGQGFISTGSGPIAGQVENRAGTVAPGNGIGTLTIDGRFANGHDGILSIEIAGLMAGTQYDQLIVNGAVTLGGALNVSLGNTGGGTFTPAIGNVFSIITADSIGGTFSTFNLPALPTGRMWYVGYGLASVQLKVTLPGDFDGNGAVNAADLAVWKAELGTRYSGADYLLWQRYFGQSVAITAVPEPSAAALFGLALLGFAQERRLSRPPRRIYDKRC